MGDDGGCVRPASIPHRVWGRHKSFRVEDIPKDKTEEVIDHMMANYFKEEPTGFVLEKTKPFSIADKRHYVTTALSHNMALYAVDEDNDDEIAGVTFCRVASRMEPYRYKQSDMSRETMRGQYDFLLYCYDGVDMFTYESGSSKVVMDYTLEAQGLSVAKEYRGEGVGKALIQARHRLATEMGLRATMGIYTSIYSQGIILSQGMKVIKDTPYSSYRKNEVAIFAELNSVHHSTKIIGGLLPDVSP